MTNPKKRPVILDGDPGHDDAMAWMLAQASPELDILAVTSAAGNQTIEKTTFNARRVCALLGITAPIAMGLPAPLLCDPITAGNIHGQTGLDGPSLPQPEGSLSPLSAVELMAKVLRDSPDPVTIIATGPETNVAALLLSHPELKPKIAQISVMGGGLGFGNWTPAAEFNILADPEAAEIVFSSGLPLLMSGLDVTEQALIFPEDFEPLVIRWRVWWQTGWSSSSSSTGTLVIRAPPSTTRWPLQPCCTRSCLPFRRCTWASKPAANTAAAPPWATRRESFTTRPTPDVS